MQKDPDTCTGDTESAHTCRICLSDKSDIAGDALAAPCACSGTNKYVHISCLTQWFQTNAANIQKCPSCKAPYFNLTSSAANPKRRYDVLLALYPEAIFSVAVLSSFTFMLWRYFALYLYSFFFSDDIRATPAWRNDAVSLFDFVFMFIISLAIITTFHCFTAVNNDALHFWTVIGATAEFLISAASRALFLFLFTVSLPSKNFNAYYIITAVQFGILISFYLYTKEGRLAAIRFGTCYLGACLLFAIQSYHMGS